MPSNRFTLTEDHIKLTKRMNIDWDESEAGAPTIDPKRPYGNKDVAYDVCEILGWSMEGDDGDEPCWSSKQRKRADKIHREMGTALEVILTCQTFEPGIYENENEYGIGNWRLVS